MLVASMSLEEIRRSIEKELPSLQNKMMGYIDRYRKFLRKYRAKEFERYHEYTSLSKNRWLMHFTLNNTTKCLDVTLCIIYQSYNGYAAIVYSLDSKSYCYYTPHFLKRYNERLNLNLTNIVDKMKLMMSLSNKLTAVPIEEVKPGVMKYFGTIAQGVVLGTFIQSLHMYKFNTFISHDMLRGKQHDLANYCASQLEKYLPFAEIGD